MSQDQTTNLKTLLEEALVSVESAIQGLDQQYARTVPSPGESHPRVLVTHELSSSVAVAGPASLHDAKRIIKIIKKILFIMFT